MSKSDAEQEVQSPASVYDFLYQDLPRISAFLAQLDDGLLQTLKRSVGTSSADKDELQENGKVGLSSTAWGRTKTEGTTTEARDGLERTFDPLWTNAIRLMDLMDSGGWLGRDIATAGIGRCVVMTGSLLVMDMSMLRAVWKLPNMRAIMMGEPVPLQPKPINRKERRKFDSLNSGGDEEKLQKEAAFDLLDFMPHTIQGYLLQPEVGSEECFFTLQPSGLSIPSGDLMMKHGIHLGEDWTILGIVDAVAGGPSETASSDALRVSEANHMATMFSLLTPPLREIMGRPEHMYSMTPLLIFRPISRG